MTDNIEINYTRDTTATKIDNIIDVHKDSNNIYNTTLIERDNNIDIKDNIVSDDISSNIEITGDNGSNNEVVKGEDDKSSAISKKSKRGNPQNLKPFEKGKSGNPLGRAKMPDEAKAMLKSAAPDAVKLLVETANDKNSRLDLRIKCSEIILDRVYGKAVQPIDGLVENVIQIVFAPTVKEWGD